LREIEEIKRLREPESERKLENGSESDGARRVKESERARKGETEK
jgi:hypothetical protein